MKKKTQSSIFLILIMGIFLVSISSCKKDDDKELLSKESSSPTNATNGKTMATFNPNVTYGTVTDQEGNIYKTVTIGTQTWMAENLRTTKYNDGTDIPNVTDDGQWETLTRGAYCTYSNTTNIDTIATYGRLYNWYAVNTRKLAPKGWHVPSDNEWATLITYLGGGAVAHGKLRETGTSRWGNSDDIIITNETGFTALPGGFRYRSGGSFFKGSHGNWWSTNNTETPNGYRVDGYIVNKLTYFKENGLSVRCVKD